MRVLVCLALIATACALQNGLALTPQMGWNSWCDPLIDPLGASLTSPR